MKKPQLAMSIAKMRAIKKLGIAGVTLGLLAGVPSHSQAATIFNQNFESGLGINESTSGNFVINTTGFGNNGSQMMGHATTYSNNEYSYYQISGLSLIGFTNIQMSFDYQGLFEQHFDRFNVLASAGPITPPSGLLNPTVTSNMQFIDLADNHRPQ